MKYVDEKTRKSAVIFATKGQEQPSAVLMEKGDMPLSFVGVSPEDAAANAIAHAKNFDGCNDIMVINADKAGDLVEDVRKRLGEETIKSRLEARKRG